MRRSARVGVVMGRMYWVGGYTKSHTLADTSNAVALNNTEAINLNTITHNYIYFNLIFFYKKFS